MAEKIQRPYYDWIWTKTHKGERNTQLLLNHAYEQLKEITSSHNLSIVCDLEDDNITSEQVLGLARQIIQYASRTIIEALSTTDIYSFNDAAKEKFENDIELMLTNYMTPSTLTESIQSIPQVSSAVKSCMLV